MTSEYRDLLPQLFDGIAALVRGAPWIKFNAGDFRPQNIRNSNPHGQIRIHQSVEQRLRIMLRQTLRGIRRGYQEDDRSGKARASLTVHWSVVIAQSILYYPNDT
jgi:hypothetical protein